MAIPMTDKRKPANQLDVIQVNTRHYGGQIKVAEKPKVIVDMREFRSSLPPMLYGQGIDIIPCTLQVGDYILSPDMCVERKSISDLIQSFASGRLYTQCESMSLFYKIPILLIEFEENKSFSLQVRKRCVYIKEKY
jgi:DNA excision repair protein ERCC-4